MSKYGEFKVVWIDRHREPQVAPDPEFPNGIDVDVSDGKEPSCRVDLPYPAKRCGMFYIECKRCGINAIITTAGRPDDPRSFTVACDLGSTRKNLH
jgi:hypothetical protein